MKQVKQVVILPTEKELENGLVLIKNKHLKYCKWCSIFKSIDGELRGEYNLGMKENHLQSDIIFQHIYFTDNSEIKEGDWFLINGGKGWGGAIIGNHYTGQIIDKFDKKIISSTDKEITPNSWIPESFVKKYIEMYNAGTPITEVKVEYEEQGHSIGGVWYDLKTREDGSIIISLIESRTYTREEVTYLIEKFTKIVDIIYNGESDQSRIDKFIEEYL